MLSLPLLTHAVPLHPSSPLLSPLLFFSHFAIDPFFSSPSPLQLFASLLSLPHSTEAFRLDALPAAVRGSTAPEFTLHYTRKATLHTPTETAMHNLGVLPSPC